MGVEELQQSGMADTWVDPSEHRKVLSRMKRYKEALTSIIEKMKAQIDVRRQGGQRKPVPGHIFDVLNTATGALTPPGFSKRSKKKRP